MNYLKIRDSEMSHKGQVPLCMDWTTANWTRDP